MWYIIPLLLMIPLFVNGLIGFDCRGQQLNFTSISLLGIGECDIKQQKLNSTQTYIQLLQLSEYSHTEIIQCKAEISRTIHYCGMHSHLSTVSHARMEYLLDISHSKCHQAIHDGTFSMGTAGQISGLKPNTTSAHSMMLAGSVTNSGDCQGTQYSDPYGTWSDVIVDAIVRITIKTSYVPVYLNTGQIMLKSGTICPLKEGHCVDSEDGHTYWKAMPTSSCNFDQYDVLYEGLATKMSSKNPDADPVVYSLITQDITFALTAAKEQPLCGYTLLTTEHPKLFILETKQGETFKHRSSVPVNNLDIFTYVNSKFVYVEKHIRQQMMSLYHNVINQRCELEKEVLRNTLSFATLQPDEFAYRLMKGPGYMAVAAGEVIHVVKCIPVDVMARKTSQCFLELPVTIRNTSLFLTPKSHLLTKSGTERECSFELPTLYLIEDTWVQFTPEPHIRENNPQRLQPMTTLSWKYLTPGSLATNGIYSQADIDKLRNHIMFPAEKPALLNSMARGITGHTIQDGSMSLYNLLDEESLQRIGDNIAKRIWGGFITFGSATAGVFGILLLIRLIKLTIDTLIHGYALHTAYGCSLYVLGAVWSSLTHLLLYFARGSPKHNQPKEDVEEGYPTLTTTTARPIRTDSLNAENEFHTLNNPIVYSDLSERLQKMEEERTRNPL